MYQVKKEDLIGDLEGLPIEVVQKMIEHQFTQTGKCDVLIFQTESDLSHSDGGFTWRVTPEKEDFWRQVILFRNFDLFFEKYPKKQLDLRGIVEEWVEEKDKYLTISQNLKTIFDELDKKIQEHCGQKFNFPELFFVGNWAWCSAGFMVYKWDSNIMDGFGSKYRGSTPINFKKEQRWSIPLRELKALNEGLSNISLENIFDEIVKLNS